MLAVSVLLARGDIFKCLNFFLDPDKPLSVKIIIVSVAIAGGLFFRWFRRTHPD
jgi:hypothetical protein